MNESFGKRPLTAAVAAVAAVVAVTIAIAMAMMASTHLAWADGNGGANDAQFAAQAKKPKFEVSFKSNNQKKVVIQVRGTSLQKAKSVSVPVWSEAGGQDDIVWYPAKKSNGDWLVTVSIAKHKTVGSYNVHVYAKIGKKDKYMGSTAFSIEPPKASVKVQKVSNSSASFEVVVSNVASKSGIKKVYIPVWSNTGGQDDIVWYEAKKLSNGNYKVKVSAKNHNVDSGTYHAHAYVESKNGTLACVGTAKAKLALSNYIFVKGSAGSGFRTIYIKNPTKKVTAFPTWSSTKGQDDIQWYSATSHGKNLYSVRFACSNFKHAGKCITHIYAGKKYVGQVTFNVNKKDLKVRLSVKKMYNSQFNHGYKGAEYQKYIVIHDTEGGGIPENVVYGWLSNGRQVSAHFIIGKDGRIVQTAPLDAISHHAGFGNRGHNVKYGVTDESRDDKKGTASIGSWCPDYGMNSYSIGIELIHMGNESYPIAQLEALDKVISYIDSYYGFKSKIIDHKMWRIGNSDTSAAFAGYLKNYQRTHSYKG